MLNQDGFHSSDNQLRDIHTFYTGYSYTWLISNYGKLLMAVQSNGVLNGTMPFLNPLHM